MSDTVVTCTLRVAGRPGLRWGLKSVFIGEKLLVRGLSIEQSTPFQPVCQPLDKVNYLYNIVSDGWKVEHPETATLTTEHYGNGSSNSGFPSGYRGHPDYPPQVHPVVERRTKKEDAPQVRQAFLSE